MIDRFETFSLTVFRIYHHLNKIAGDEMKKFSLKGSFAFYLITVSKYNGEITAAKLGELCVKDKAEISRAVAAMEEKGLMKRCGENGYRAKLILTELGSEVVKQIYERASLAVELGGKGLTEKNRAAFYEALEIITGNLKTISEEGLPK